MLASLCIPVFTPPSRREIDHQFGRGAGKWLKPPRAWCAGVVGKHLTLGYQRHFLAPRRDYRTGGLVLCFILEHGQVYEVNAPRNWRDAERYYCVVGMDGSIVRVAQNEVDTWLKSSTGEPRSALMS